MFPEGHYLFGGHEPTELSDGQISAIIEDQTGSPPAHEERFASQEGPANSLDYDRFEAIHRLDCGVFIINS